MEKLIERFSGNEFFTNTTGYKDFVMGFNEQFVDQLSFFMKPALKTILKKLCR